MKMFRIGIAALLTLTVSGAPAFAGELRDSVAAAATAAAKTDSQETPMKSGGANKAMVLGGSVLFAGGMAYGLFEFINNKNGSYSEFGEAAATNKKAGAAGLSIAFAGGAMMLLGKHGKSLPSLTFGAKTVGLAKKVSW
ncbi:MAG: hypothetical protein ABMA15_19940 [Vicinamibacterales bacterium]